MSERVLPIPDENGDLVFGAELLVYALMLCPTEEETRTTLLENLYVQMACDLLEAKAKIQSEGTRLFPHLVNWVRPRANREINDIIDRSSWLGALAGDVLLYALRIENYHPPGSLNKAVVIVTDFVREATDSQGQHGPRSDREVKRAWKEYRSVAHLWGAIRVLQCQSASTCLLSEFLTPIAPDGLSFFLAIAETLRQQGTLLIPHGQQTPLLPPGAVWQAPSTLRLPRVKIAVPPLEEWAAKILQAYRAPKSF